MIVLSDSRDVDNRHSNIKTYKTVNFKTKEVEEWKIPETVVKKIKFAEEED
jgi:hypothetical protein